MHTIRHAVLAIIGAATLLTLSACAGEAEAPADQTQAGAGLTIANARLVLAPVSGNPAAVYFDLSYSGKAGVTLADVDIEGAGMAMIHEMAEKDGVMTMSDPGPVALADGATVTFAPGGLHVMAMEPSADWQPGGTVNVTVILSDGTSQTVAAAVRAAGDDR